MEQRTTRRNSYGREAQRCVGPKISSQYSYAVGDLDTVRIVPINYDSNPIETSFQQAPDMHLQPTARNERSLDERCPVLYVGTKSDNVYFHLLLYRSFPAFNTQCCGVELLNYKISLIHRARLRRLDGSAMRAPRAACHRHIDGHFFRFGRILESS